MNVAYVFVKRFMCFMSAENAALKAYPGTDTRYDIKILHRYKALTYLSSRCQFEPLPVEGKNPATVVLLLSSPEEDILVKACEAIHTFAEKGTVGFRAAGTFCLFVYAEQLCS